MAPSFRSVALVAMLMLAVMAASSQSAEARQMEVHNNTPGKIKCNDKEIEPGQKALIEILLFLKVQIFSGGKYGPTKQCLVPLDVKVLAVVYADVLKLVQLKVIAILNIGIGTLLNAILCSWSHYY